MNILDMRIKTRLMGSFAELAGVVVVVSGLAINSLSRSNDARLQSPFVGACARCL